LSCAIIVQKNKTVQEVVDFLRGALPDVPVVGESATNPGADNPLGMALLSLLRAAAHPRERFNEGHVLLTPLAGLLSPDRDRRQAALRDVQRDVYQRGFEPVICDCIGRIDVSNMDPFAKWRAKQFLDLARQFDETGSRDIDEFVRFVTAQEAADASGARVVQVMTVHKAKGLTFDATILPDIEGSRLDKVRKDALHTHKTGDGDADWILSLPGNDICEVDNQLGPALAEARSEVCYENFCKLYVGLTRASHGLYVVSTAHKPSSKSLNYIRLLHETLAEEDSRPFEGAPVSGEIVFESGGFDWVQAKPVAEAKPLGEPGLVQAKRGHVRLAGRRASVHGSVVLSVTQLFAAGGADAISFGLAVHKVFEQIEWVDDTTPAKLEALREPMPEAVDEVARCLADETVAKRLAKPEGDVQLWRERAFDVVVDNEMISGVFDRVHVYADRAEIIDFKSDRVGDDLSLEQAAEKYAPQMATYRQALAKLTGLAESAIRCSLVFTHPCTVVEG
jgi:ATP-dependent helicase/nuclease subunit A